jgi:predicted RNA-binding Zn-ribbon protein involved in translation (DUF1610 family)
VPESKSFECQSCGSALTVQAEETQVKCPYCGRENTVPENLRTKQPAQPEHPDGVQIVINVPEGLQGAIRARIEAAQAGVPLAHPRRRSSGCVAVLILLIIVLVLGVFGVLQGRPKVASVLRIATPTPTVTPVHRPLQATLPRTLRYANLEISVTDATISNQTPARQETRHTTCPTRPGPIST